MGTSPKRIVIGITGASGAVYARTVIRALVESGVEVHLVVTRNGQRLLNDELGMAGIDLEALAGRPDHTVTLHPIDNVGASIASGSFLHDGMIIVPASSNALGMIAGGLGPNLLYRAAAVALKERRPLIICHRESPLTLVDIENMRLLALAGAVVAPANPGWYLKPNRLEDVVDFVAAKLLDLIGVEHSLSVRWSG